MQGGAPARPAGPSQWPPLQAAGGCSHSDLGLQNVGNFDFGPPLRSSGVPSGALESDGAFPDGVAGVTEVLCDPERCLCVACRGLCRGSQ